MNIKVQGLGARFGFYFDQQKEFIREYRDRLGENKDLALNFYRLMYEKGIYYHGLHNGFSSAHSPEDIDIVLNCTEETVKELEQMF